MMRKDCVLLVFGDPGEGKSYLAKELASHCGYSHVAVDSVYVHFIKQRHPELDFKWISRFILEQYQGVLEAGVKSHPDWWARDPINEWQDYLTERLLDTLRGCPRVAVEGSLLLDDTRAFIRARLPSEMEAHEIRAIQRQYEVDGGGKTVDAREVVQRFG